MFPMTPVRSVPLLLLSAVASLGAAPAPAADRVPVLLVTGANNHDWEWTSATLEAILAASGKFDVTVTREPAAALADAAAIARYRAFVLDYNGPRWGDAAEKNFLDAVRSGTGVAVIHAANNAFPGWKEYETLAGLCWREGTGHGKFHAFDVRVVDRGHPVTRGLPDLRAHPDELYHDLVHMHGAPIRVLATAHSAKETGGTGEDEPMIVVQEFGKGRVFHTPLGHAWKGVEETRVALRDPQLANLIVRGVEWAATGRVTDGLPAPNSLTSLEKAAGWRLLFDGETPSGWRAAGREAFPDSGWEVVDGALRHRADVRSGDLVSTLPLRDFEAEFEWKVAAGGNSGVKYRAVERPGDAAEGAPPGLFGPEYQILDGAADEPSKATASLYSLAPAAGGKPNLAGAYNHSRIVARGAAVEHWLNGERVVAADVAGPEFEKKLAASGYASDPGFGGAGRVFFGLQDHGDEVWFRSLRARDLAALPGEPVALFDGRSLAGWRPFGDARYAADAGSVLGETGGGAQSFLLTEASYGDFLFEVDVLAEGEGNSGIQVRSRLTNGEKGPVVGYQIEIDPSDRAYSGGLYDEARRGWLQSLEKNEAGRRAFRKGEWNRYRIECVGPSIRAWVNGVPTADVLDATDLEGVIGLQVHSGKGTRVRWRDFAFRDLGKRRFEPSPADEGFAPPFRLGAASGPTAMVSRSLRHDATWRIRFRSESGALRAVWIAADDANPSPTALVADLGNEALAKLVKPNESNVLTIMAYGPRVAVTLNGTPVSDVTAPEPRSEGRLALATSGTAVVESIEILSEARR